MAQKRLSKVDRRQQILESSLPIFARYGLAGTTTKMLAEAAKVTEPVLYQHFKSKEELYQSLETFCLSNIQLGFYLLNNLPEGAKRLVFGVYFFTRTVLLATPGRTSEIDLADTKNITRLYLHSLISDGQMAKGNIRTLEPFISFLEKSWNLAKKENCTSKKSDFSIEELWLFIQMVVGIGAYHLPDTKIIPSQISRLKLIQKTSKMILRGIGLTEECIEKHFKNDIEKELSQLLNEKNY